MKSAFEIKFSDFERDEDENIEAIRVIVEIFESSRSQNQNILTGMTF